MNDQSMLGGSGILDVLGSAHLASVLVPALSPRSPLVRCHIGREIWAIIPSSASLAG